ncbi:MAG: hypothetical protein FWD11_03410 [Micrococcales bacterium]|nr:hypothetical protein [Micrococcales bacterium]
MIWNAVGSLMFSFTTLLMVLVVSHLSDDLAVVGSFGFALVAAQLLYYVGLFGTSEFQMTDYRRAFAFVDYARLKLYSSVAMAVSSLVLVPWVDSAAEAATVGLLTGYYVLCSVGELYQNVFFQNRRLDLYGKALFLRSAVATVSFAATMVLTRQVVVSLAVCLVGTAFGVWWGAVRPVRRDYATVPDTDDQDAPATTSADEVPHRVRDLARQCLPLFLIALVSYAIQVVPRLVVKTMMGNEALGYFTLYTQPAFAIILVNHFVFRPVLDRYHHLIDTGAAAQFWRLKRVHLASVVGATAALMVVVYFFGVPIMRVVAGADLAPVRTEMTVVVAYGGALVACGLNNWMTTLIRRQKEAFWVYLGALVLSVVLVPVAVHLHGLMGASVSLVAVLVVLQAGLAAVARYALTRGSFATKQ